MFDNRAGEAMALNWRGPLLAAGIFASAFAILLVMARQNQSKAGDQGSSFRQDPYGTSLLFDSYERAGYRVDRSEDENSLDDRNASETTAFFVGGFPYDDWSMEGGKLHTGKFRERLEKFLAHGGRVVLVNPAPGIPLESKSQGWEVQNEWTQRPHRLGSVWIAPNSAAMPPGSERMYLSEYAPFLKTNAHWTVMYLGPVNAAGASEATSAAADDAPPARVYMASWRIGQGELIAASQESFLLNEAIKTHPNPVLLDFLAGGRPVIWVDETLHGLYQGEGVLWLMQRYRLDAALLLFWSALLALLWSMSGDLVRRPSHNTSTDIIRRGENPGVAGQRLLERSVAATQLLAECWEHYRRRSPHDAQAIMSDPQRRAQLRTALEKKPVEGYRELVHLIAERRASGKASDLSARRVKDDAQIISPKRSVEETTIA